MVSDSLQPHGLYSPPGSSVHGILEARILVWAVIPIFRVSFNPGTELGFPALQASEPPGKPAHEATKKLKHVLRVKNTLQRFPAGRLAIWGHSLDLPSIYQNLTEEEVNWRSLQLLKGRASEQGTLGTCLAPSGGQKTFVYIISWAEMDGSQVNGLAPENSQMRGVLERHNWEWKCQSEWLKINK